MNIYKYKFKLEHDHGTKIISIAASNEQEARRILEEYELCPERAITLIDKIQIG